MIVAGERHSDLSVANEARDEAQRYRARWVMKVASGEATIFDVIEAARQPYGDALTKIRLGPLLALDPAVRRRRKQLIEDVVKHSYSGKRDLTKINIGWLITRSDARFAYFVEAYLAFANVTDAPADRFPWVY
jgi:hypothetical protein